MAKVLAWSCDYFTNKLTLHDKYATIALLHYSFRHFTNIFFSLFNVVANR